MLGGSIDLKPGPGVPPQRIIQCVAAGGPELTAYAQTAGDTYGTLRGNRGCYGVNLFYEFDVSNTGSQAYPLFVYGQGRNVSNAQNPLGYFGPLSILSPWSFGKRGVSQLRCEGSSPSPGDYVRLTTSDGKNETPVIITVGEAAICRIGGAVGGAASTPFNIVLKGIAYQLTEPPH